MRIKIIQNPTVSSIDGVQLDHFIPGFKYQVGTVLAAYLIAEGWAEPIVEDSFEQETPPNLTREIFPPYYDGLRSQALERRRHRRRSS